MKNSISRRQMLAQTSTGFGLMALTGLMADRSFAVDNGTDELSQTHHPAKAKHVIFCFMSGGVSQVDSFDPKPELKKLAGKPMPTPIERTQFNQNGTVMPSPFEFSRHGESGLPVSSIFPQLGKLPTKSLRNLVAPIWLSLPPGWTGETSLIC